MSSCDVMQTLWPLSHSKPSYQGQMAPVSCILGDAIGRHKTSWDAAEGHWSPQGITRRYMTFTDVRRVSQSVAERRRMSQDVRRMSQDATERHRTPQDDTERYKTPQDTA